MGSGAFSRASGNSRTTGLQTSGILGIGSSDQTTHRGSGGRSSESHCDSGGDTGSRILRQSSPGQRWRRPFDCSRRRSA